MLRFVLLDTDYTFIAVFTDASFASKPDSLSQIGVLICLMDKLNKYNSSSKSGRVAKSALPAKLFEMV